MPIIQTRNASMQELSSADQLNVQDRNWGAEWYDSVGGGSFLSATTVPLVGERINSAPEVFVMASSILTILEAGLYFFNFSVTAANSGSAELIISGVLQEDPDTGVFANVLATTSVATFFNGSGSLSGFALLRVGLNYRYRLQASRIGGAVSPTFVQFGSKLCVVRLFKNG